MLFHFFNHWVSPLHDSLATVLPSAIQRFLEHADLGVEVFFVISGFVIAHSLYNKEITPGFAGNFILRRSLRLDPPYWIMIAASVALPYLLFRDYSHNLFSKFGGSGGLLVNMFYLPDLLRQPRIVGVAWTLCLEVQFYLMFLFILAIRGRHPACGKIRTAAFALLLAYSVQRWFVLGRNDFGGRWFMFFTGVLAYWTLIGRIKKELLLLYATLLVGLIIKTHDPRSGTVLIAALLVFIAAQTGGLQRWLAASPIQYLGRISYSLYLVHMMVGVTAIQILMPRLGQSHPATFATLAAAIVASIGAADVLHRYIESPAMRLSNIFRIQTEKAKGREGRRRRIAADEERQLGMTVRGRWPGPRVETT